MIIVDRRNGVTPERAEKMAIAGLRPYQAVLSTGGAAVISPGNPEGLVGVTVDLWLPPAFPPATVPQLIIAGTLVRCKELGGDSETLQYLTKELFDCTFLEMQGIWKQATVSREVPKEESESHLAAVD